MFHQIAAIARHTLREVIHSRLLLIAVGLVLLAVLAAEFIGSTALTEGREIKAGIVGWGLRWLDCLLLGVFVITSQQREQEDRVTDLFFSMPMPREYYYLGKLFGFLAPALFLGLLAGLAAALYSPLGVALGWMLSHMLELAIVAAFALLIASVIGSTVGATAVLFSFYLLARGAGSLQLMARGPFYDNTSFADRFLAQVVDGIALLLPPLDRFARTDWLVVGQLDADVLLIALHALVYLLLLCTAGLVDLRRKQL